MILVYDTETTGLVRKELPPSHPSQPHLVQLGCVLFDDEWVERAQLSLIVKPEGYTIPETASNVHGITTEKAHKFGLPLQVVVAAFTNLRGICEEACAYNIDFDERLMDAAIIRTGRTPSKGWPEKKTCIMRTVTPIVGLPPTPRMVAAGYHTNKPPNLGEAIKFFFDEPLPGAHDALVDAKAAARILAHIRKPKELHPEDRQPEWTGPGV